MPGEPDIWMPLDIGNYLKNTMHLGRADHGSYLLLCMAYWYSMARDGNPLPDDNEYLAAVAKCSLDEWTQSVRTRLARFFQTDGGVWRHAALDQEIERAKMNREAKSRAGRAGNEAKARMRLADGTQTVRAAVADGTHKDRSLPLPLPLPPERALKFKDGKGQSSVERNSEKPGNGQGADSEDEFMDKLKAILTDDQAKNDGGKWRNRFRKRRADAERVLNDVYDRFKTARSGIRDVAAALEDTWNRFGCNGIT
jgi:uncharacterized protein YdaU (DUF1376 family)